MYFMVLKPISPEYFINPSRQSVYVYVHPHIVARQQLGKDVPAAKKDCWRRRFICGPCRIRGK
jgi:hypothetical protein